MHTPSTWLLTHMSDVCDHHLLFVPVKTKNSVALFNDAGIQCKWAERITGTQVVSGDGLPQQEKCMRRVETLE